MSGDGNLLQTLFTNVWGWVLIILFFNGAIIIHELGHFLAAKWRGLKVERFSIFGLGPKIVGWRGKDGVEYCFCWIPFGAFVALPQLADMKSIEGESDHGFRHADRRHATVRAPDAVVRPAQTHPGAFQPALGVQALQRPAAAGRIFEFFDEFEHEPGG